MFIIFSLEDLINHELMKRFAVYLTPDENLEKTVFIKEGFSFKAFFLTFFWSIYNRLYYISFFLILLFIATETLAYNDIISDSSVIFVNFIGSQLLCGFNASDWIQNSLLKKNFKLVSVIFASNLNEAQVKFFAEYNTQSSNVEPAW